MILGFNLGLSHLLQRWQNNLDTRDVECCRSTVEYVSMLVVHVYRIRTQSKTADFQFSIGAYALTIHTFPMQLESAIGLAVRGCCFEKPC